MARILVVEDDDAFRTLMADILKRGGHEVFEARHGQEALVALGLAEGEPLPAKPDLLVLDVMMPHLDGFALANHLLQNVKTRRIPIIVLTAKAMMRDAFHMTPNVVDYLTKPIAPEPLRQAVDRALLPKTGDA